MKAINVFLIKSVNLNISTYSYFRVLEMSST